MKIDVQDLLSGKSSLIEIDEKIELSTFDFNKNEYKFDGPIHIKGNITKIEDGVIFVGTINAQVITVCSRCLEEVKQNMTISFEEEFTKSHEDLGYQIMETSIDITKLIEDNLLLNLPLKTLCSESCKGLCPVCGTNLNKSTCNCETQTIDPRLEKLKNFFNRD
ncbi:YceD family protein [Thermobrachium celere]|uniref:YceD family protein n=1 Tax=Thermobrachium celere TaxID=53422 RepID=UPI0019404257|nr:DUF177 domain-containing protein [Thermobrachium celere]GFR36523.1 hypothetical protein TCEA9_23350 [Thermobrachium celere]